MKINLRTNNHVVLKLSFARYTHSYYYIYIYIYIHTVMLMSFIYNK